MDLGGNPRLVAEELADTAITVTPAVTTTLPLNPSNPVIQMNPANPAPPPAPVMAPTPMVAPATPLVASEAIIFRPISPPTGVSRNGQPMRVSGHFSQFKYRSVISLPSRAQREAKTLFFCVYFVCVVVSSQLGKLTHLITGPRHASLDRPSEPLKAQLTRGLDVYGIPTHHELWVWTGNCATARSHIYPGVAT